MRLRNKKTGDIWEIPKMRYPTAQEDDISFFAMLGTKGELFCYRSIAELNEEWEDYKPAEPLIKDEKIRKAVRAWWNIQENPFVSASVLCKSYSGVSGNKDHDGYYNYCIYGYVERHNINKTATDFEFRTKTYFEYDRDEYYTLDELCGEEEE